MVENVSEQKFAFLLVLMNESPSLMLGGVLCARRINHQMKKFEV